MLKTQGDIKQYESSDNLNTSLVEDKPCDEKHIKIEEYESKHLNEAEKTRGVAHIEAIVDTMKDEKRGRLITWVFAISILLTAWAYALDGSTTFNYQPFATSSFNRHSMISTVEIATRIISSICKPFLAKISDITSRPITYIVVLVFYVLGYIISAASPSITAFVIGEVFVAIGGSGLTLMNSIIVADLTPLKWRGFINSLLATPFIINCWFAGLIVQDITGTNWRWGYGMFAIIIPVCLLPAIIVMLWLDRKATKTGKINIASCKYDVANDVADKNYKKLFKDGLIQIDAMGLVLLGFAFSLLLLPFSLYSTAEGKWHNPSMIAMVVVGGILLIVFTLYEMYLAPFPCMPKRIITNRTFICAVIIDFIYMLAGYIRSTYFSSYVLVVKDWSVKNWTYYNNTLTLSLCIFGVVAGAIQRITHRYKELQIAGLAIKLIGMGLFVKAKGFDATTALLVMGSLLVGMGGSFSVVGSRVASEASVPHQDLALVISLLSLWSSVGAAIGSAIAAPIWNSKLPDSLREYLPKPVNETLVSTIVEKATFLAGYPYESPVRVAGIKAYGDVTRYLFVPALCIAFIPLFAAFFQTGFYLGDQLNAVEGDQPKENIEALKAWEKKQDVKGFDRVLEFFNRPLKG